MSNESGSGKVNLAELSEEERALYLLGKELGDRWEKRLTAEITRQVAALRREIQDDLYRRTENAIADHLSQEHPRGSLEDQIDAAISSRLQAMGLFFGSRHGWEAFVRITTNGLTVDEFMEQQRAAAAHVDDAIDQELGAFAEQEGEVSA